MQWFLTDSWTDSCRRDRLCSAISVTLVLTRFALSLSGCSSRRSLGLVTSAPCKAGCFISGRLSIVSLHRVLCSGAVSDPVAKQSSRPTTAALCTRTSHGCRKCCNCTTRGSAMKRNKEQAENRKIIPNKKRHE